MTCMWSNLIEQKLLDNPDATISVHDVLEVIQHSLVLLGNMNELLSQMRRKNILQVADKSLGRYGQDSPSHAGEFLFGPEFTKHLQDKVDSNALLAKVVSTSQRYHPYGNTSRANTIGCSKQFFRGALPEIGGHGRAMLTPQYCRTTTEARAQQDQRRHTNQPHQRGSESAAIPSDIIHIRPRGTYH